MKDYYKTDNISVLKNSAFWESQLSIIVESIVIQGFGELI